MSYQKLSKGAATRVAQHPSASAANGNFCIRTARLCYDTQRVEVMAFEVRRLCVRGKKKPLAGVLGVGLTSVWRGASHESPTPETVEPAEVPGRSAAGGGSRASGP